MRPYMNNTSKNRTLPRRNGLPRPTVYRNDSGPAPYLSNLNAATIKNTNYRTALWTGKNLQMTVMSIPTNESIGLEIHPDNDQFIYVEQGQAVAMIGEDKNNLHFRHNIFPGFAVIIPAGKWHNVVNTGKTTLKIFTIYAPPHHPKGTVHITQKDSEAAEY